MTSGRDETRNRLIEEDRSRFSELSEVLEKVSDDWLGYSDDLGDYAGRCEMFAGPKDKYGYRTGTVFKVDEECDCGCYPPSPNEMDLIWLMRRDVPRLLALVRSLAVHTEGTGR